MCGHVHQQEVRTNGGDLLARICTACLLVFCKDCHRRVFWPDSDAKVREIGENDIWFCRCRPATKGFAHRRPGKVDAV
jgi:hypothetical protein